MNREKLATLAFFGFAVLMAFRDSVTDLYLKGEKSEWISFIVCGTILLLSSLHILLNRQFGILAKLRVPGAAWRVALLGLFSGIIYLGIFFLIDKLGAALAGFIDYGLLPLVTILVGRKMFKEKRVGDFLGSFVLFALGLFIIMATRTTEPDKPPFHFFYLVIALLVPFLAALSDGFTKWLLDEENAGLTRGELLAVRFLPATVTTYIYCTLYFRSGNPAINDWSTVMIVAVVGGWIPLMLLCTGLGKAGMNKLAAWEFIIPVIILLATYRKNWGLISFFPLFGAVLILGATLFAEFRFYSRLKQKYFSPSFDNASTATTTLQTGKSAKQKIDYDVALSFAGEDRNYVEQVAAYLQNKGVRVFYDNFKKADLWGKNLIDHLGNIYAENSRFIVIFVSKHYAGKKWPDQEHKSARERAFNMQEDCILPARFDDTELPGLSPSTSFIDLRTTSAEELGELIIQKIRG